MPFEKLLQFTDKVADLPDKPNTSITAAELKAQFDAAPEELRTKYNQLIEALQSSETGDSGASQIGSETINGVTGLTVHDQIKSVFSQLQNVALGQIPDGGVTAAKLNDDAKNAKIISVDDPNNRFAATKLDGVLDELFTFANNGKTSIANVVGSPAKSSDTFNTLTGYITSAKEKAATNLTAKGTTASSTETLDSLVSKIASVTTGRKIAMGTAESYGPGATMEYTLTSGVKVNYTPVPVRHYLGLLPSLVFVFNSTRRELTMLYNAFNFTNNEGADILMHSQNNGLYRADIVSGTIPSTNSIYLPVYGTNIQYNWVAIE